MRRCKDFRSSKTLLPCIMYLYKINWQFAAPMWSSGYNVHVERIEMVQKNSSNFSSKFNTPIVNQIVTDSIAF